MSTSNTAYRAQHLNQTSSTESAFSSRVVHARPNQQSDRILLRAAAALVSSYIARLVGVNTRPAKSQYLQSLNTKCIYYEGDC